MCNRIFVLAFLIAIICLVSTPAIQAADPVGRWKLDEGSGTTTADSSGNGNHGTLAVSSGPSWITPGCPYPDDGGNALSFPGVENVSQVTVPHAAELAPTQAITVSAWVKMDTSSGHSWNSAAQKYTPGYTDPQTFEEVPASGWHFQYINDSSPTMFARLYCEDGTAGVWFGTTENPSLLSDGEWHHVAFTYATTEAGGDERIRGYTDGVLGGVENSFDGALLPSLNDLQIGNGRDPWEGIDDVRFYDEALTPEEILSMASSSIAVNPYPSIGSVVDPNVVLTWEVLGDVALVTCDVYLGTDPDMANNPKVATGIPAIGASFDPCGTGDLESDTQYYWRVDTNDAGTVYEGDEWTFFTWGEVTDPDLIGWWKFDTTTTTLALDSSGYGHNAAWMGAGVATWYSEGVVEFDGTDEYFQSPFEASLLATDTMTVTARVKIMPGTDTWWDTIVRCLADESSGWTMDTAADTSYILWNTAGSSSLWNGTDIQDGQWHQIVCTFDNINKVTHIYTDGIEDGTLVTYGSLAPINPAIGLGGSGDHNLDGFLDEVRLYTRVLSVPEIRALDGVFLAYNPTLEDGARGLDPNVVLSWEISDEAPETTTYNVYIGTDPDMIDNIQEVTGLTEETFDPCGAGDLEDDTMYYWRVDTDNSGEITTGDVWFFTTIGTPIDPSLVGWWKLDETSGDIAKDSSGYGNAGILNGLMDWYSSGYINGAADFAYASSAVGCGSAPAFDISGSITVSAWIKVHPVSLWWNAIAYKPSCWGLTMNADSGEVLWSIQGVGSQSSSIVSTVDVNDGLWHHVAGVYTGAQSRLYIDGVLEASESRSWTIVTSDSPVRISNADDSFNGLIDEVRIYSRALDSSEITDVFNYVSFNAGRPNPADGATSVYPEANLGWFAGSDANSHDVYFGTDLDAVTEATNTLPIGSSVYKGNQAIDANSYEPGPLEWGQTYYWRIDEVNDLHPDELWKGRVWSFTTDSGKASNPDPVDNAYNQGPDTVVSWSNGIDAGTHDVYFGTTYGEVDNADNTWPEGSSAYKGNQALDANSYSPAALEWGRTYYWRIDEVNDAPVGLWRGDIWQFTVGESHVVDDFESYSGDIAMLVNWTGVDGATLNLSPIHPDYEQETTQSMMITYDNTAGPYYSEAAREYATAQDWDSQGFDVLRVWFFGDTTNVPEQMYLKIADGAQTVKIDYPGQVEDINAGEWLMWTIDLDVVRAGLNLANVKKISIGIGEGAVGGTGSVYVDIIVLNKPTCIGQSVADMDNDCTVGFGDAKILASEWLSDIVPLQSDLDYSGSSEERVDWSDYSVLANAWRDAGVMSRYLNDYVSVVTDGGAGGYDAFPSVVRLMDGRLMTGFTDAHQHNGAPNGEYPDGGRASYVTSSDEGQTWSAPSVMFDSQYSDGGSITQLSTGRLICINTYSLTSGADPWGVNVLWSDDGGETWTDPNNMVAENYWSASTNAIEISTTGRIVHGLYYESNSGTGTGAVIYSDDNAETWSEVVVIPNGGVYLSAETAVIELNDGRLYAAMRGGTGVEMHESFSEDQGQTWSVSKPMGFSHNGRPCLWRVHDDDGDIIVMGNRMGNSATGLRYSLDECQTWSDYVQVDHVIGAYPSMVTLNDGSILIVYYAEDDLTVPAGKQANVRARRFTVDHNGIRFLQLGSD